MQLLQEPSITLEGVKIRAVSRTSIDIDVTIRVQNPNPVGITLRETPFLLMIRENGSLQEVANGNTGAVSIPARNSTVFPVPVTSRNEDLVPALAVFVMKGELDVTIKGVARIDAVVTCWSLPFEKTITVTMAQVAGALNGKTEKPAGS